MRFCHQLLSFTMADVVSWNPVALQLVILEYREISQGLIA